ncbi:MAG: MFS transporter [Promethearchaeota archaeon]|jgi:DHA3 family macrolide efflux protein-like MFS transporter
MDQTPTKRNFRHYMYFLFGQQFSMLGSLIVGFVITWWITVETGNPIYLSLSVFLMFIPQIVLTPLSGVLADRWNRKTIIAISDSLQAFVTFLLFLFFLMDIHNIWLILAVNTFRAGLFAFQLPAVQSLIPVMVPRDNLSRINGLNFLFSGLIFSIGPVIAATLLEFFPVTQIFFIDIVTFLIALIPLLLIKIPLISRTPEEKEHQSFVREFKTGLSTIKMIPGLLAMIAFAMIWNFIHRPWAVLTPYFVRFTHDGSAFDLALLMTSFQVANIIGSLIMSIKKTWKHKIKLNIIGASLYFVGQLPAIFAPKGNFLLMMLSLFGGAIIFPLTVSTYLAIIQNVVPKDKIGRVMSLDHMISMAIAPIGALLAGPLVELIGIVNLFFICALIGIVFPYFIWFFTKIRQLEIIDQEKMTESEKAVEDSDVPKLIEVAQISEPIE